MKIVGISLTLKKGTICGSSDERRWSDFSLGSA
jgi:hypothetical protein